MNKTAVILAWTFLFAVAVLIMVAVVGVLINMIHKMGWASIVCVFVGVFLIWLGAWAIKTIENNKE